MDAELIHLQLALSADREVQSCGCVTGTAIVEGEPTFLIDPCGPDCRFFRGCMEIARTYHKPVQLKWID